jgi:hypothetical protein
LGSNEAGIDLGIRRMSLTILMSSVHGRRAILSYSYTAASHTAQKEDVMYGIQRRKKRSGKQNTL